MATEAENSINGLWRPDSDTCYVSCTSFPRYYEVYALPNVSSVPDELDAAHRPHNEGRQIQSSGMIKQYSQISDFDLSGVIYPYDQEFVIFI